MAAGKSDCQANGIGAKTIAKKLNLSKNAVKKYMRSNEPPCFNTPLKEKLVDGYEEKISEMLDKEYIGTRIYSELIKLGYTGSLSTLHRYIQTVKTESEIKKRSTTRFETDPGEQMQYDWKEWVLPIGGRATKVYIHELILCYSRKKHYSSSLTITASDIMRAIYEGIIFFGGLAAELVIDNPKQMILKHSKSGVVQYNDEFLKFCGIFGINPNPCSTYWARTKGKVERPFYFIQEHLLRGLEVENILEFDSLLKDFTLAEADRIHSTLNETPNERFLRERQFLRPLPKVEPTRLFKREVRKVTSDGYVNFGPRLYPVPMRLCLKNVLVESILGKEVRIFDEAGQVVGLHPVDIFNNTRPTHPEHEAMNQAFIKKKESKRASIIHKFIDTFGEDAKLYAEGLNKAHGPNLICHLSEILAYGQIFETRQISEAIKVCLNIGSYHKNSVKKLLNVKEIKPLPTDISNSLMFERADITRSLSAYRVEVAHE